MRIFNQFQFAIVVLTWSALAGASARASTLPLVPESPCQFELFGPDPGAKISARSFGPFLILESAGRRPVITVQTEALRSGVMREVDIEGVRIDQGDSYLVVTSATRTARIVLTGHPATFADAFVPVDAERRVFRERLNTTTRPTLVVRLDGGRYFVVHALLDSAPLLTHTPNVFTYRELHEPLVGRLDVENDLYEFSLPYTFPRAHAQRLGPDLGDVAPERLGLSADEPRRWVREHLAWIGISEGYGYVESGHPMSIDEWLAKDLPASAVVLRNRDLTFTLITLWEKGMLSGKFRLDGKSYSISRGPPRRRRPPLDELLGGERREIITVYGETNDAFVTIQYGFDPGSAWPKWK